MKGQDVVIRALALLKARGRDLRYVIAGRGPDRNYFEDIAREEGVQDLVIFADYIESERLGDFYNLADIYVMLSRAEQQEDRPVDEEADDTYPRERDELPVKLDGLRLLAHKGLAATVPGSLRSNEAPLIAVGAAKSEVMQASHLAPP
jgi:glycosyltransferase involved in cell wall biosynthesis